MASKDRYTSNNQAEIETFPFEDTEEAWFWFIQAQQAKNDGARFVAGQGALPRPCEPIDILKVLDRLYRQRRLLRDHLLVLRHYGRRQMVPDPHRIKESRAHSVWVEALERLSVPLEVKGIIKPKSSEWHKNWNEATSFFEGMGAQ